MSSKTPAGSLIELDGTMNLRDLGGWPADGGVTAFGQFYRSDRLSDLSDDDHRQLASRGIVTVIDLRYRAEIVEHPSRLWSTVEQHHEIPMGGELADQRSFIDRVLAGELDGISDTDVGRSYVEMLATHGRQLGLAIERLLSGGPGLYHCTAGKDRTGLLSMLILSTVGVTSEHILDDFALSNEYRAEKRMRQLRPTFESHGLDIEQFRPALSAPRPAMTTALEWLAAHHGSAEQYLAQGGVRTPGSRLRERLVTAA